jgi:hypothetical protein
MFKIKKNVAEGLLSDATVVVILILHVADEAQVSI